MEERLATFKYVAVAGNGTRIEEQMQALTAADVVTALHRSGFTPIKVTQVGAWHRDLKFGTGKSGPKLSAQQRSEFCHQLHQLLKAGISISQALSIIAESRRDADTAEMMNTISERLIGGTPLSQAFDGFPRAFDPVFKAYLAAAEESGDLVKVTAQLVEVMEKRAEIRRKVVGVTIYPALVTGVVLAMLVFIMTFLVPRYADIYDSFDAQLPLATRVLITASRFMPFITLFVGALVFAFILWNRSKADDLVVGERLDRLRFKAPIMGKLFKKLAIMRFCQTAGGALAAGVQAFDSVELAGRSSGSRWVRATVPPMQNAIREGRPLSTALEVHSDLYPPTVRTLVSTGEATGELAAMMQSGASALEDEIDVTVSTMSAKIEVALLVFMAISVGSILVALYLPILTLTTTISESF